MFEETAQGTMKFFVRMLLATIVSVSLGTCCSAEVLRVAVQKTGTFAWELAVIRAHGLDKQANLSVEVLELASPEAGKIALRAGNADIVVTDWLWVSRERGLGAKLTFYPYSSALGAVMAPASSPIKTLADLKGRKLAVAGGPIDKSWLLLLAWLKKSGIDLKLDAEIAYGAPPLLAAKTLSGEMDATLNYWNFCAGLEARLYQQVATGVFGIPGPAVPISSLSIEHHRSRILFEKSQLAFELVRQPHVVRVEKSNVLTRGLVDGEVVRCAYAAVRVARMFNVTNLTREEPCPSLRQLTAAVTRAVVDQYQFPIRESLCEDAFDRFAEKPFGVQEWC